MPKTGIVLPLVLSSLGSVSYGIALFLADILIAYRYGTGSQAVILQSAIIVSTLLIGMWSGGAIIGAFVPMFVRLGGDTKEADALAFMRSSLSVVLLVMLPLLAVTALATPHITAFLASGFTPQERAGVGDTLLLLLPMVLMHCLAYVYYSVMISIGRPGFANFMPLLIPVAAMASFPLWGASNGSTVIALGYNFGAFCMLVVLAFKLKNLGFSVLPARPYATQENADFTRIYLVSSLAYAALAGVLIVSQATVARLSSTDFAHFSYAIKLVLLGTAFYTSILNSVVFPKLTKILLHLKPEEQWQLIARSLAGSFVLGSVATAFLYLSSELIVELLYFRGDFSAADVAPVSHLQKLFALQIPFYFPGMLCWRLLNNSTSTTPLVIISTLAILMNAALSWYLVPIYQVEGGVMAYVAAIALWSALLTVALRWTVLNSKIPMKISDEIEL
jgi:putative peptidoglycan lipid II flippase